MANNIGKVTNAESMTETPRRLVRELVGHLREKREPLRRQWVEQMTAKGLLAGLTPEETETESATIYDTCVGCLETRKYDAAQAYATSMAERGVLRGMTTEQIIGGLLTLRDVYGRALFERYQRDIKRLSEALDAYEPVANKILSIVALAFMEEREKVVRQQQEAIRELSTPVLQVWEGVVVAPFIGTLDTQRAQQFMERLLERIVETNSAVALLDVTGLPSIDTRTAQHLVETITSVRLLGAQAVMTGVRPAIAQTLVHLGINLADVVTRSSLADGLRVALDVLNLKISSRDGQQ